MDLLSLSFVTTPDLEHNLQTLLDLAENSPEGSLVVACEVALSGFAYDNLANIAAFAPRATAALKAATKEKTLIVTMLEELDGGIYNTMKIFHRGEIIHQRAKARLFALGDEQKYMKQGDENSLEIIEIDGVKVGVLICFELRFKEFWHKLEGADVIAIPAWWGALRGKHLETLSEALSIMNQCYVVVADSANVECSALSGIISPFGIAQRNGNTPCLKVSYEAKEIERMRRYIDVGIK